MTGFENIGFFRSENTGPGDVVLETTVLGPDGTRTVVKHVQRRSFSERDCVLWTLGAGMPETPCVVYRAGWMLVELVDEAGTVTTKVPKENVRRPFPVEHTVTHYSAFCGALAAYKKLCMAAAEEEAAKQKRSASDEMTAKFAVMSQAEALMALSMATKRLEALAIAEQK